MRPGPEVTDLRDPSRRPAGDQPSLDVLENATIAIHSVDEHGVLLWANRAELEMLGYAHDEYVGRSVADFHVDRASSALTGLGKEGEIAVEWTESKPKKKAA